MAHRGRLNVLANIMGKRRPRSSPSSRTSIPSRCSAAATSSTTSASRRDRVDPRRRTRCTCRWRSTPATSRRSTRWSRAACAPSSAAATTTTARRVLGILIHGDAAFAGQGLVAETLNLSTCAATAPAARSTSSSTTRSASRPSPAEARSTRYCTDVAKMHRRCPIFHVNGEDPEAVAHVGATGDRLPPARSSRDVVIDMYCYRRYGHNEGDEPSFTQPLMYQKIEQPAVGARRSTPSSSIERRRHRRAARSRPSSGASSASSRRSSQAKRVEQRPQAGVRRRRVAGLRRRPRRRDARGRHRRAARALGEIAERITPAARRLPARTRRSCAAPRAARADGRAASSRSTGAGRDARVRLAAARGHLVRLSGQDSRRGTFSHRHAVLVDVSDGAGVHAARAPPPDQAPFAHLRQPAVRGGGARLRLRLHRSTTPTRW